MTTAIEPPAMTLVQRMNAIRELPPPTVRRALREAAGLSREAIAAEIREQGKTRGIRVTGTAVGWWERERAAGGYDPRPATALVYRRVLDRIQAELQNWVDDPASAQK